MLLRFLSCINATKTHNASHINKIRFFNTTLKLWGLQGIRNIFCGMAMWSGKDLNPHFLQEYTLWETRDKRVNINHSNQRLIPIIYTKANYICQSTSITTALGSKKLSWKKVFIKYAPVNSASQSTMKINWIYLIFSRATRFSNLSNSTRVLLSSINGTEEKQDTSIMIKDYNWFDKI